MVESIQSVLAQTYQPLELIVIDDGSTDQTPQHLLSFRDSMTLIRQKNQGSGAAVNQGLKIATGDFICWLASDDVYLPNFIAEEADVLQAHEEWAAVFSDFIVIDAMGRELKRVVSPFPSPERFVKTFLAGNFINGSTVMVRKKTYQDVGFYDEALRACADGDMWLRILAKGYRFGHVPLALLKYRWHASNISHKSELMRKCRDEVSKRAFKQFAAQGYFKKPEEFWELAIHFAKQLSFQSAREAAKQAFFKKPSIKKASVWSLFSILGLPFLQPFILPFFHFARKLKRFIR